MINIGIVLFFSLIFGISRQLSDKPIGFGTFIFVSVGACALSITALSLNPVSAQPLLAAIVTGIGFLGAGALIRNVERVSGFTNAATIWIFAIFGLLIGINQYLLGFLTYGVIVLISFIDSLMSKGNIGSYRKRVVATFNKPLKPAEVEEFFKPIRIRRMEIIINRAECNYQYFLTTEFRKKEYNLLFTRLLQSENIKHFHLE